MKGVIFTEFTNMVDDVFSPAVTEEIISACDLPSGGAYTSVGDYGHGELIALVGALAARSEQPARELVRAFGAHLAAHFARVRPEVFRSMTDAFELMENVDGLIHGDVRKLYPNAELPTIACERRTPDQLIVDYRSPRGLGDAAEGLIAGVIAHYGAPIDLTRQDMADTGGEQWVRFTLTR
ncbi:MAG: heme NO-binding domain-containing protein [Caulobacterales bacterium]|nr:heme NO-binding domain-containing protein [Caulobacterales bacterium]